MRDVHSLDNGCFLYISFALLFKYFSFQLALLLRVKAFIFLLLSPFNCNKKDYNASKNTD